MNNKPKKKILVVAMASSIHVVRWIEMILDQGWEIHLFNSLSNSAPHPELSGVIYYDFFYNRKSHYPREITYRTLSNKKLFINGFVGKYMGKGFRFLGLQKRYEAYFHQLVEIIEPDVIHSMETQHAGYIVNEYYGSNPQVKPYWIHSTWGLDIDYFRHFPEHDTRLREVFSRVDLFVSEGQRDLRYAKDLGFTGESVVFPCVAGGYKLEKYHYTKKPSARKVVLIKGYQDSVRRALFSLAALRRCKDVLKGFELVVFSPMNEVKDYITYLNSTENLSIKIYKDGSYDQWVRSLSEARTLITNNLSDGNPSTLFECMLMGVLPIQSITSCADEWLDNGTTGFLVQPENVEEIAQAIRRALSDDVLVNNAAEANHRKASAEMNFELIKSKARRMYSGVLNTKPTHGTFASLESKIA